MSQRTIHGSPFSRRGVQRRGPQASHATLARGAADSKTILSSPNGMRRSVESSPEPCLRTRATVEVHHFFSNTTPQFGSFFRPFPDRQLIWRRKKELLQEYRVKKKSHVLRTRRESCKKKKRISDGFGSRSPVIHEKKNGKKLLPLL